MNGFLKILIKWGFHERGGEKKMKMKVAKDLKIDQRVNHKSHGSGTVYAYATFDDEIFVDFDVQPGGWDKILCVTPQLLTTI